MKWYFDTSVLVAAAVTGHVHYPQAIALFEGLVRRVTKATSVLMPWLSSMPF